MSPSDSTFVTHTPCEKCGSSDANSVYTDGHTHCFKCQTTVSGGDISSAPKKIKKAAGLVEHVEFVSFEKRRLTEETCRKFGYGLATVRDTVYQVAPYHNADGEIVAQKLRGPSKKFSIRGDISQAGLFGQHLWRDGGRKIVITEGEIDCLTVSQLQDNRWPVVSIPNGAQSAEAALKRQLEWLEGFEEVVFMFDMDDEGRKAAQKCALLLTPGKAKIASLPLKDASEMLQAGRGKEVIDALWGAKTYRPDGLVTGSDLWAYMKRETLARSVPYPYASLNAVLRGARVGEVTTIVAGTGTGKSTFCKEVAYHLIAGGEKIGYIALEESVGETMWGLLSVETNQRLTLETDSAKLFSPDMEARVARIQNQVIAYDHWGSLESDNLIAKLRYCAKAESCSYIFLDHLSIVVSGMDMDEDERRTIDRVMTTLGSLAKETGVGFFVVCHLKKPTGGGATHEEGRPVTLDDLRGSGGIKQLSWNVISLERNQQSDAESCLTQVRVLKNRKVGKTGPSGVLRWNEETGRLLEVAELGEIGPAHEESSF